MDTTLVVTTIFSVAQQLKFSLSYLIVEVSRLHTSGRTTLNERSARRRAETQETNIGDTSGIRNRDPSNHAAAD